MNAKELGRKLLDEVEETNLQELLSSLHVLASTTTTLTDSPPYSHLNVRPIDALIFTSSTPNKSSTHHHQPNYSPYPVVEIISANPGTGKTQVLYHFIAAAVLPHNLGGRGSAVVVMDTDAGFDISRLAAILRTFIHRHLESSPERPDVVTDENTGENVQLRPDKHTISAQDIDETIHHALHHVHIFRPTSLASLVATIQQLPTYLLNPSAHYSSNRPVSLLLIDSITAFFWQQRMAQESRRHDDTTRETATRPNNNNGGSDETTSYGALVTALRATQTVFGFTIIATHCGLLPSYPASSTSNTNSTTTATIPPSFRPLLPHPWPNFLTLRLTLATETVNKFPVEMGLEAAVRDRGIRQAVVEEGRRGLWVWDERQGRGRRICGVRVGGERVVVGV